MGLSSASGAAEATAGPVEATVDSSRQALRDDARIPRRHRRIRELTDRDVAACQRPA